ncbi:MAG: serine hydrolase [Bacteroidetes bacterium]|nr:serine hydrolase [Bacteroidota bacterium]
MWNQVQKVLVVLVLALFMGQLRAQNYYFPPKTGTTWASISPADLGFCPDRIDSLYRFLSDHHTKSFILLKDGKIVLEKYFGTFVQDSIWYWASAGKSLSAFMAGMALESGILELEQPVSKYLGTGWTSCPSDKEALIKVRHQLTMTTGLDDGLAPTPGVPDPDNCTDPACLVYKADAGTRWAYHNAPYRLIHNVLEAASGKTLQQYTKLNVLDRTGMKGIWYDHIMYGRARDMARFGLLVLAGGRWGNDTLLHDQTYFYNMTHRSQELNKSYGYLWWLNGQGSFMLPGLQLVLPGDLFTTAPPDLFAALGKNDQKIHVVPSKGWVVVRQGDAGGYVGPGGSQVPIYFDTDMWKYLNALTCGPSAATEAKGEALQVWPNPASDVWNVRCEEAPNRLILRDLNGREMWRMAGGGQTAFEIPAASLGAGMYLLEISGPNQIRCIKLLKS